ncbi:MAG: hypothetical protein NC217_08660, partial [Muribaculaceae bacterium]|nr:hypothetical protein [Muribaculaceae bacterium]
PESRDAKRKQLLKIRRRKLLNILPLHKIGGKLRMQEYEVAEIITNPDKMTELRKSEQSDKSNNAVVIIFCVIKCGCFSFFV